MSMTTYKSKKRNVVGSFQFGFDEEPESFLNNARVDMAAIEGVHLYYKQVQAWHTCRDFMFFMGPLHRPCQLSATRFMRY